jgi:hypothetical protein
LAYFSRSVAAPTSDSPVEFRSDLPVLPDTLRFESRFESGNLMKAIRITEAYYELHLRPDLYTQRHCQWFYFQVGKWQYYKRLSKLVRWCHTVEWPSFAPVHKYSMYKMGIKNLGFFLLL